MTPVPTVTGDVPPMVNVPQPTQAGDGPVREEATGEAGAAAATMVPGGSV